MEKSMIKIKLVAYGLVLLLCAAFLFAAVGCGIPKNMRVRSGIDPRYQDDDVRFQTTYYFRVFDPDFQDGGVQKDSLYRFRMTGKANSLSNKVHFESGILHKDEIDPFGAAVVYDKKLGRYRYVSQSETKREKRVRNDKYDEIKRMIALYDETEGMRQQKVNVEKALSENIVSVINDINTTSGPGTANRISASSVGSAGSKTPGPRRGFQILGPEGWEDL